MATSTRTKPTTNGHRVPTRVVGEKDRRMPWLALGILLVLGGGLGAGLLIQSVSERTSVVVAARQIGLGQVIESDDLRIIDIAVDGDANTIPASQLQALIGQVSTTRIAEGALIAAEQIASDGGLDDGTVIVGASLGPGQLPVANLQPGQRVRMISAGSDNVEAVPLGEATIYRVFGQGNSGNQFVSLAVNDADADIIAHVVAQQRLRLILIPRQD